ncbi:hypothetical protein TNCV_2048381 [Trichonephila clavipes]|nr:hypothetical protein TNCV_2048381 [Trichonephila clavipes]
MVWGGISIGGRTDLHIIRNGTLTDRRYADEIVMSSLTLEPLEIPLFSRMIMPDRIELIWWRTCLKLKQYSNLLYVNGDAEQSNELSNHVSTKESIDQESLSQAYAVPIIDSSKRKRTYYFNAEWEEEFLFIEYNGGRISAADDEPAGRRRSAITDQNIAKIRDMSGFLLTSLVRLLINSTSTPTPTVIKRFREKIKKRRPELGIDGSLLHQKNASGHIALSVKQFLTSKNITMMAHPPYSPDLTPGCFFLFPTVKTC